MSGDARPRQLLEEVLELEEQGNRSLRLETGEVVRLEEGPRGQSLQLISASGEVLLAYDPVSQRTRIRAQKGDLQLVAEQGNIDLAAARDVRVVAGRSVQLGTGFVAGRRTLIDLRPNRLGLKSPLVSILGEEGELRLDKLRYFGQRFQGTLDNAKVTVGSLTVMADRVKSTAKNICQRVENLLQIHAGRARTVVEGSYHTKAKQLFLKAVRDAKVKGKKIYLG